MLRRSLQGRRASYGKALPGEGSAHHRGVSGAAGRGSVTVGRRRAGRLGRRSGGREHRRGDSGLPGRVRGVGLPPGPRVAHVGRAPTAANHERVGPFAHRGGHPPGRQNRPKFLHRPRHRRGDRRDDRDRRQRQDISGRNPGGPFVPQGRTRAADSGRQAASDGLRQRYYLRQRDRPGRGHGDW